MCETTTVFSTELILCDWNIKIKVSMVEDILARSVKHITLTKLLLYLQQPRHICSKSMPRDPLVRQPGRVTHIAPRFGTRHGHNAYTVAQFMEMR